MSWQITDYDELFIEFDNGLEAILVPKFRMIVGEDTEDTDYVYVYWCQHEGGGHVREFHIDYNDVLFGYVAPSSASELVMVLEQYMRSAFSAAPGDLLSNKGDLLTHDGASDTVLPVGTNDYVLTADSTDPNGIVWKALPAPTTPSETYLDFTTVAVDGINSASEQILRATLIPANTITDEAVVEVWFEDLRATSAANAVYRVRLHTSAGAVGSLFSSGTIYYGVTIPANTQTMRYFVRIRFPTTASQNAVNGLVTFNSVSTGAGMTSSLNANADMYVVLTVQKTTGSETWGYDFWSVKLIQP